MTEEAKIATKPSVFKGSAEIQHKYTYYNTTRMTITMLDGHRLSSLSYGFIVPSTLLGAAATAYYQRISGPSSAKLFLLCVAFSFTLCAVGVFVVFMSKYLLFNGFIGDAVNIAKAVESDLLEDGYAITKRFDRHWLAGHRGRWLIHFILFIVAIALLIIICPMIIDYYYASNG